MEPMLKSQRHILFVWRQKDNRLSISIVAKHNSLRKSVLFKFKGSTHISLLIGSGNDSRTGSLSDGLKWSFWHNHNGQWYFLFLNSKTKEEASLVLCKYSPFIIR